MYSNFPKLVGETIGNADLEPQRTTVYEIGLQQGLTDVLGFTITGYYKDIRNLLGQEIHIKNEFKKFGEYVNRDYGQIRGLMFSLWAANLSVSPPSSLITTTARAVIPARGPSVISTP